LATELEIAGNENSNQLSSTIPGPSFFLAILFDSEVRPSWSDENYSAPNGACDQ